MQPTVPMMFGQMMAQSQPMLQQQPPLMPLQTVMPQTMMPAAMMQPHPVMVPQHPGMPMVASFPMANSPEVERGSKYDKSEYAMLTSSAVFFGKLLKHRLQQVLTRVGLDATLTADLEVEPILKMVWALIGWFKHEGRFISFEEL